MIGNPERCLDFIAFFDKRQPRIYEISAPLYKNGLSITDISDQTGLSRGSIWKALRSHQHELRPQEPVPFDRWRQGHGKGSARAPYGFRYFDGRVIQDPDEYPNLLLINNLRKQGLSISSIVSKLGEKRILSRMKKSWSYNVVKATIRRLEDGSLDKFEGHKKSPKRLKSEKGEKT